MLFGKTAVSRRGDEHPHLFIECQQRWLYNAKLIEQIADVGSDVLTTFDLQLVHGIEGQPLTRHSGTLAQPTDR